MTPDDILTLQRQLRAYGETEELEAKAAKGGTPKRSLREAISAFANHDGGGTIVLGMDEATNFTIVGVQDTRQLMADIAEIASTELTPPIRVQIQPVAIGDQTVVVVQVPELTYEERPCYINAAGMQAGAYRRIGASNRQFTAYEIASLNEFRTNRSWDDQPVHDATIDSLDRRRVDAYIVRLQERSNRSYASLPYDEALERFGIVRRTGDAIRPTLAGLLVFGDYPQQFLPQQRIVVTRYWGTTVAERGPNGERFVDDLAFDGSIQEMLRGALAATITALPSALSVDGLLHTRTPEIPEAVVREALINALGHRDYGFYQIGSFVHVRIFTDRVEIESPGGLYGGLRVAELMTGQSTRNPLLMRFLEDLDLVEDRGTGIDEMVLLTSGRGLPAPEFLATSTFFRVVLRRNAVVQTDTTRRIREGLPVVYEPFGSSRSEAIRGRETPGTRVMALVREQGRITNTDLREELGLERWQAARLLQRLVAEGKLVQHGERRGAYYELE